MWISDPSGSSGCPYNIRHWRSSNRFERAEVQPLPLQLAEYSCGGAGYGFRPWALSQGTGLTAL